MTPSTEDLTLEELITELVSTVCTHNYHYYFTTTFIIKGKGVP